MSKLYQYNGKEWIEIAKNGQDAIVDYNFILSQIPKPESGKDGKDGLPDTRLQIVEKINSGKKEDTKIELKQIQGVEKLSTQESVDRALSILDKRTQFLINKQSGISSITGLITAGSNITLTGDGTLASPYIINSTGGAITITGGTNTAVLFDDNGVVGEDAGLVWNKTLNRLTITDPGDLNLTPLLSVTGNAPASFTSTAIVGTAVLVSGFIGINSSGSLKDLFANVAISTNTANGRLTVNLGTDKKVRYIYNNAFGSETTYMDTTISSSGGITYTGVGSSPDFTFSHDVLVPDEVYGAGWNGSLEVPTKNAVYDKIETLSGLAWGASIAGTTADGVTLTLSNTSDAAAAGLKIIAGNTQSNQPLLANLQIGSSANVMGLLIQGTGSSTGGATGTGKNHMTLWANINNSTVKVLSAGYNTSYQENLFITASGKISSSFELDDSQVWTFSHTGNFVQNNPAFVIDRTANQPINGGIFKVNQSGVAMGTGIFLNMSGSGTLVAANNATSQSLKVLNSRTHTAATTITDTTGELGLFKRTNISNNASANYTVSSPTFSIEQVYTQTAGTLAVTGPVLSLINGSGATGAPLSITQNNITSTHFRKIRTETNTGWTEWVSDGTDPNGALSGTAGDICYNGATNKPAYCTGTTNWTNLV